MAFIKPINCLNFETKKGNIEFSEDEYLIIDENKGSEKLMITKQGIQKIEDFFEVDCELPIIQQQWNTNNNFNIIVSTKITSEYGSAFGIASANPLNLSATISVAYGTEMAVKRSRATACLELLRKNYVGTEPIALLYSSFDEFKTEESVNRNAMSNLPSKNPPTKVTKPKDSTNNKNISSKEKVDTTQSATIIEENDKNETKASTTSIKETNIDTNKTVSNSTNRSEEFDEKLFTRKYEDGISLEELLNTDREYLKQLGSKPNKYRNLTLAFLEYKNLSVTGL